VKTTTDADVFVGEDRETSSPNRRRNSIHLLQKEKSLQNNTTGGERSQVLKGEVGWRISHRIKQDVSRRGAPKVVSKKG